MQTHASARAIIERAGGAVVGERLLPLATSDPAPLTEAIERPGPENVLSTFFGANAVAFEREFHRAGVRERCRTLASALGEATLEHVGADAGRDMWSVMAYFEQLPTAQNRTLVQPLPRALPPVRPTAVEALRVRRRNRPLVADARGAHAAGIPPASAAQ